MTDKELDAIFDELDRARTRKREIDIIKAQAESKAVDREFEAYIDGAYAAIKSVKMAMQKEREKDNG